jgi:hypothetical protein
MRKTIIILLVCFLPLLLFAAVDTKDSVFITTATDQDGFTSNISNVDGQAITSGVVWSCTDADRICDQFDLTTACYAAGPNECDMTYDVQATGGGSMAFDASGYNATDGMSIIVTDNTNANLQLQEDTGAGNEIDDIYCRLRIYITSESLANSEQGAILWFFGDGYAAASTLMLYQDGSGNLRFALTDSDYSPPMANHTIHGTNLSTATWYEVTMEYRSGAELEINVDEGTPVSDTTGITTQDMRYLGVYAYKDLMSANISVILDDVKCDDDTMPTAY